MLTCLLWGGSLFCFPLWVSGQSLTAQLDSVFQHHVQTNQFSGVVLVAADTGIVFQAAAGFADAAGRLPLRVDQPFHLASVTKAFTAILVMQAVAEGRLRLDQSLAELLPELSLPQNRKITVHHLLLHTSGLPVEPDSYYLRRLPPRAFVTQLVQNQKAWGKRGKFRNANADYLLLGLILEKTYGQSWEALLRKQILVPLEMTQTGFLRRDSLPARLPQGLLSQPDGSLFAEPSYQVENFYAAGCMYGTAQDLLKLDRALHQNTLLPAETKEKMFTSHPELGYVAYGFWSFAHPMLPGKPRLIERRGEILGFRAAWVHWAEQGKCLIVLSNSDRFNPDTFGDFGSLKDALLLKMAQASWSR